MLLLTAALQSVLPNVVVGTRAAFVLGICAVGMVEDEEEGTNSARSVNSDFIINV